MSEKLPLFYSRKKVMIFPCLTNPQIPVDNCQKKKEEEREEEEEKKKQEQEQRHGMLSVWLQLLLASIAPDGLMGF